MRAAYDLPRSAKVVFDFDLQIAEDAPAVQPFAQSIGPPDQCRALLAIGEYKLIIRSVEFVVSHSCGEANPLQVGSYLQSHPFDIAA